VARKQTATIEGRPPESRADSILETSAQLFFERGYGSVSIRDIGAAAGVSSSTLYHYFADKQEILYAITERFAREFLAEMKAVADRPGSPADRLSALVVAQIHYQHARRHHLLQGSHFRIALNDAQRAHVLAQWREYRELVVGTIADGVADGTLHAEDPRLAATMILDMVDGLRQWFSDEGTYTLAAVADEYAGAALRICRASAPTP
jgi:AcrR family transcriptional regulator